MEILSSITLTVLIIAVSINLILGVASYRSNNKSTTNVLFTLLSLVISAWLFVMYNSLQPSEPQFSLLVIRLTIFIAAPMSLLFYLFAHTLPSDKLIMSPVRVLLLVMLTIAVMVITLSPFAFTSVETINGFPSPTAGPGMGVFALSAVGFTIGSIFTLYKKYKTLQEGQKNQALIVLWGIVLMYGFLFLTVLIPVVLFKFSGFVSLFPISSLFFTSFAAYAIIKHKLLELKILAVEGLIVLLWIVLFSKVLVTQSESERAIDIFVFFAMIVVGVLLMRAVSRELDQKEQLTKLAARLQEMDHRKDEFLSIVAHELRAPMTAIKGYISMLLEGDAGDLPDDANEYLKVASKSNDRLIRLVNNLLNVSRIEEGRQVYQMGILGLIPVVKSVFDEFRFNAEGKNLRYTLDIGSTLPPDKVYVDKDRIHEVVSNFISNAIKYTDTGSILVKVYSPKLNYIRMEVSDTGKGIALVDQKKLFQKYYRVESAVGRAVGTGLGLYISKLLVEKFGGLVGFVSQEGKGSNFWFELPTVPETTEQKPNIMV